MMTQEECLTINNNRAVIYQWFGGLFALEQTSSQLDSYAKQELLPLYELLSNVGLQIEVQRFQKAMEQLLQDDSYVLELSADFAQHFLLDDKVSTLPYASFYLEDGRLYGDVESKMRSFLQDNHLTIKADFKEPADHLAVYLYLMAHWIQAEENSLMDQAINAEQILFLQNGLLSWLPDFVEKSQQQALKYDVYSALSALLLAFIQLDIELLESL